MKCEDCGHNCTVLDPVAPYRDLCKPCDDRRTSAVVRLGLLQAAAFRYIAATEKSIWETNYVDDDYKPARSALHRALGATDTSDGSPSASKPRVGETENGECIQDCDALGIICPNDKTSKGGTNMRATGEKPDLGEVPGNRSEETGHAGQSERVAVTDLGREPQAPKGQSPSVPRTAEAHVCARCNGREIISTEDEIGGPTWDACPICKPRPSDAKHQHAFVQGVCTRCGMGSDEFDAGSTPCPGRRSNEPSVIPDAGCACRPCAFHANRGEIARSNEAQPTLFVCSCGHERRSHVDPDGEATDCEECLCVQYSPKHELERTDNALQFRASVASLLACIDVARHNGWHSADIVAVYDAAASVHTKLDEVTDK